jgi:hypothetical protein
MSHIAEVYAKDLGVKIGRPHITDHFFPGLPDKYITVQSSSKMPAARYKYWDIVLGLIKPHLNDIKIIQVGGPEEEKIKGADHYYLGASYKQMNYMIKKASTHVGCDSLPGHIAGAYDVPCVILHFNLYPENSKPLWHKNNKSISISPDFSEVKPSFSTTCNRINEIKPETIAQSVLDQLNIKSKINFKTINIGEHFQNNSIEVVPDFFVEHKDFMGKAINVKANIHFDINYIFNWCNYCIVNLWLDKELTKEEISKCRNLKQVTFEYSTEHNKQDLKKFFKNLRNKKINLIIVVRDEEVLSATRSKYFDYNVVFEDEEKSSDDKTPKNCKFLSKKIFATKGKYYPSYFSAKKLDTSNDFVYDENSSKELKNLYLYEE